MTHAEFIAKHGDRLVSGIECADGWIALLDKMLDDLTSLGVNIKFIQIKEKFGTLRAYYMIDGCLGQQKIPNEIYDKIDEIIAQAERESEVTCERCGKPGKLRDGDPGAGSWILTLCDACEASR